MFSLVRKATFGSTSDGSIFYNLHYSCCWRGVEAEMARRGVVVGGGNTAAGEGMTGAGGTGGAGRWDASAAVLARLVQV